MNKTSGIEQESMARCSPGLHPAGCLAAICGVALPVITWAVPAADNVGDGASPSSELTEIVVTANRTEERLQDVPITVTAVSGEELQAQGIVNSQGLANVAPSLVTSSGASDPLGTNYSIHGVGTSSFQRTIEPSVALILDDVSLIRPEMGLINFNDLAQVEVLNGPQGFLFGKNASAGAIVVRTNDPAIGTTSEHLSGEYGSLSSGNGTSEYRVSSVTNVAVSEQSALRLNLSVQHYSPLVENVLPVPDQDAGLRQLGGSAKYLWRSSDRLSVLLAGDYMDSKGQGAGYATYRSIAPGSPEGPLLGAVGIVPGPENTRTGSDAPQFFNLKMGGGELKLEYTLTDSLKLTSITAYRRTYFDQAFDADYGPAPLVSLYREAHAARQLSEEIRLASQGGSKFNYQVGLYYLNGQINDSVLSGADLGMTPPAGFDWILGANAAEKEKLDNYAGYGQATYDVTDAFKVSVGARVTHDQVGMSYFAQPNGSILSQFPVSPLVSNSVDTTNLSERVTLQYQPNRNFMLYGTFARGYKGPGYSQYSLTSVRPEIPTHFEVGEKSEFLDRRLTLNLSVFETRFKNFQAESADLTDLQFSVRNAGKLSTRGADLQVAAEPAHGLTVSAGVSYTAAHFVSFQGDLCYAGQPGCVDGTTDSSGNALPFASRWKGVVDLRYDHAINSFLGGTIGLDVQSQSAYNLFSNANPQGAIPGRATLDVDIGLHDIGRHWSVKGFCRNCTNRIFVDNVGSNPLFITDYQQTFGYGSFRTLGVGLDVKF
jgi:iron complex outermembrane receptor protein